MSRQITLFFAALFALLTADAVTASLQSHERYSLHSPLQPRILNVYSEGGRLYIAGQNLPAGKGVQVRLGKRALEVMLTSRTLVVTRLPTAIRVGDADLEVRRGVRRARVGGSKLAWGLQLPSP